MWSWRYEIRSDASTPRVALAILGRFRRHRNARRGRSTYSPADRPGVMGIVFVGAHEGLHTLGRNPDHLMAHLQELRSPFVGRSPGFHGDLDSRCGTLHGGSSLYSVIGVGYHPPLWPTVKPSRKGRNHSIAKRAIAKRDQQEEKGRFLDKSFTERLWRNLKYEKRFTSMNINLPGHSRAHPVSVHLLQPEKISPVLGVQDSLGGPKRDIFARDRAARTSLLGLGRTCSSICLQKS